MTKLRRSLVRAVQFGLSLVVVPLLIIAFAGCIAGESAATPPPATAAPEASAATFDDDKGAIQGTVINDEGLPLANVLVGILETNDQTVTAQSGEYTFSNVVPGELTVSVSILGYESASKRVIVEAGMVAQANFQLVPVAVDMPFYVSLQDVGNIQCSITWFPGTPLGDPVTGFPGDPGWYTSLQACGVLGIVPALNQYNPLPPSKFEITFPVTAGTQEILLEEIWQSTQATGSGLSFGGEDPTLVNEGENYGGAAGPSPLVIYADTQKVLNVTAQVGVDPMEDDFEIYTRTFSTANTTNLALPASIPAIPVWGAPQNQKADVGLAFDQKFEIWLTAFVRMEKPDQFSALADA